MSFKHYLIDENTRLIKKVGELQKELIELRRDTCNEYHDHVYSLLETVKENSNEA
jgi:hypothetical protein